MERLRVTRGEVATKRYANGVSVHVTSHAEHRIHYGPTAGHEAAHAIIKPIRRATIIPSGNALGTTVPEVMTVEAAAAAAAMGYGGTSWDMHIVEHVFRVNRSTAIAAARAKLRGQEEVHAEVATILQLQKTIDQRDVNRARENVRKRRRGIFAVEVHVESPEGKKVTYEAETQNANVLIPNEWTVLPPVKKTNQSKQSQKQAALYKRAA